MQAVCGWWPPQQPPTAVLQLSVCIARHKEPDPITGAGLLCICGAPSASRYLHGAGTHSWGGNLVKTPWGGVQKRLYSAEGKILPSAPWVNYRPMSGLPPHGIAEASLNRRNYAAKSNKAGKRLGNAGHHGLQGCAPCNHRQRNGAGQQQHSHRNQIRAASSRHGG